MFWFAFCLFIFQLILGEIMGQRSFPPPPPPHPIDASPGAVELLPHGVTDFRAFPPTGQVLPCEYCGTLWVPVGNCPNCAAPAHRYAGTRGHILLVDASGGGRQVAGGVILDDAEGEP